jgi:hypothetical protein
MERIRNFNPQKSFLELQRIRQEKTEENDPFLQAIGKIRHEQNNLREAKAKKLRGINQLKEELQQEQLNQQELD